MDLKIASLNVRGLGNNIKRREVFTWLKAKKKSIYMLQEVHCSEDTINIYGLVSGVTKRSSVAVVPIKRVFVLFSITTLISRFTRFSRIRTVDF